MPSRQLAEAGHGLFRTATGDDATPTAKGAAEQKAAGDTPAPSLSEQLTRAWHESDAALAVAVKTHGALGSMVLHAAALSEQATQRAREVVGLAPVRPALRVAGWGRPPLQLGSRHPHQLHVTETLEVHEPGALFYLLWFDDRTAVSGVHECSLRIETADEDRTADAAVVRELVVPARAAFSFSTNFDDDSHDARTHVTRTSLRLPGLVHR